MKFKKKIERFLNADIRWKIKLLGNFFSLKLYPLSFHLVGLKSIYSKIIFFLIFHEKVKKIRKKNYELIFKTIPKIEKKNVLVALPRSGSNFLRNLITSYIALEHNISNGVPKYDGVRGTWKVLTSTIFAGDMFNTVTLDDEYFKIKKILTEEELEKKIIYFTRHPLQSSDLININSYNPVILLRNPKTQIKSWILTQAYVHKFEYNDFSKQLNGQIEKNFEFLIFWKNYFKQSTNKFLIIDFDDLSNFTEQILENVLYFYNYSIDKNILKMSVEINNKNNYKSYIGNAKEKSIRFINNKISSLNEQNYEKLIKENDRIDKVFEIYNDLHNLRKTF